MTEDGVIAVIIAGVSFILTSLWGVISWLGRTTVATTNERLDSLEEGSVEVVTLEGKVSLLNDRIIRLDECVKHLEANIAKTEANVMQWRIDIAEKLPVIVFRLDAIDERTKQ